MVPPNDVGPLLADRTYVRHALLAKASQTKREGEENQRAAQTKLLLRVHKSKHHTLLQYPRRHRHKHIK